MIELHLGDFRRAAIEPGSVDVVATDPPYSEEALDLWDALGELAARVLRPGGWLVAYAGQAFLDLKMAALSRHLTYHWVIAVAHRGSHGIVKGFFSSWKPVLVYAKPPVNWAGMDPRPDLLRGGGPDKRYHRWGQPASEMIPLLRALGSSSPRPRGLVLDPMAGGGGILAAAAEAGLDAIGYEVDPEAYHTLLRRFGARPIEGEPPRARADPSMAATLDQFK
ncbi:MAG: hypothetical protein ACP5QE_07405 [Conexivisphaera sp.]